MLMTSTPHMLQLGPSIHHHWTMDEATGDTIETASINWIQ